MSGCADCFHDWSQHMWRLGCLAGWKYEDGISTADGCECKLTHVDLSPSE